MIKSRILTHDIIKLLSFQCSQLCHKLSLSASYFFSLAPSHFLSLCYQFSSIPFSGAFLVLRFHPFGHYRNVLHYWRIYSRIISDGISYYQVSNRYILENPFSIYIFSVLLSIARAICLNKGSWISKIERYIPCYCLIYLCLYSMSIRFFIKLQINFLISIIGTRIQIVYIVLKMLLQLLNIKEEKWCVKLIRCMLLCQSIN